MHAMMLSDTEAESLYVEENRFDSWDDTAVFYRYWHGSPGLEGASVVLLHDHQEHSEYYRQLGGILAAAGYRVFAWDARGSGRSTADTQRSPEFHDLVRDLEAFTAHLRREHQVDRSNMVVLGQGLGAALLCTWLHDYAPQIAGAVISSAPFRIPSQGVLRQQLLEWVARWRPGAETRPYFKLHEITADRGEAALRRDDPFVRPSLSVRLLLGQQQAMDRVLYRPESIELPLLMLSSDPEDSDVDRACGDFFERLGSIQKTWKRFESSGRALFHDGARAAAAELVKTFLGETLEGRRDRTHSPPPGRSTGQPACRRASGSPACIG